MPTKSDGVLLVLNTLSVSSVLGLMGVLHFFNCFYGSSNSTQAQVNQNLINNRSISVVVLARIPGFVVSKWLCQKDP